MSECVEDTRLTATKAARTAKGDACLVHIYPTGGNAGRRYALSTGSFLFGRGDHCDVRPDDPAVSRRHARLEPAAEGHAVTDLGSTNGTFVNDARLDHEAHPLRDGDYLRVGGTIYRYLAGGNLEAEYHEEIYRLTVQDALTRAHNRRALTEFLDREVVRSRRHGRPLSVLMVDVDKFKSINDTLGHLSGDTVLRGLADILRAEVRTEDFLARYGGEEFAVVLVETTHAGAVEAAERIRRAVAENPFVLEGERWQVTVSVGVATATGCADVTAETLIREADSRLYEAKRAGRNRVAGDPPHTLDAASTVALGMPTITT